MNATAAKKPAAKTQRKAKIKVDTSSWMSAEEKEIAEAEAALAERKAKIRSNNKAVAIAEIKAKCAFYGIEESEIFTKNKYRNPATGEEHSGRGKFPDWLDAAKKAGKLDDYLIEKKS